MAGRFSNHRAVQYLNTKRSARHWFIIVSSLIALALVSGCDEEGVDSEEEARQAYVGLDGAIAKTLTLGMQGFNEATSANIPDQAGMGDLEGMIVVSGQVDQGNSDNKGLRLYVELIDYLDEIPEPNEELSVVYDTDPEALPYIEISLRNIPDGTIQGTITGTLYMDGDLEGSVTLNLSLSGMIQDDGAGNVRRAPGTVQVTGTADSKYGTYDVDLTI